MRWTLTLLGAIATLGLVGLAENAGYTLERRTVVVGARRLAVTLVRARFDRARIGVGTADGLLGSSATLAEIAIRASAICAVNGTFLAVVGRQTGEPYGSIAVDRRWLHLGSAGTRLDVLEDGSFRFVLDDLWVLGSLDGREAYPDTWYAYGLNQMPQNANSSYVFTPERGARLGFRAGFAAIVSSGTITRIARGEDVSIPRDGFVIALSGNEIVQLGSRFTVGRRVAYRVNSRSGQALDGVRYSLGAGPKLVTDGLVSLDPAGERFVSSKILVERGDRSAVGFNAREIIFAVIADATVRDEAEVMRALGARDAMNLDGGASSALWCGKNIVAGGRKIANALVLWER